MALTNKLLIVLGDGGTPTEIFAWPCGGSARSVTYTNNTGEEALLDCADPSNQGAWVSRWVESQDTSITISGRVDTAAWPTWRAWADGGTVKNVRVRIDETGANNGGYHQLPAILQGLELTSQGKATIAFSATIVGAGKRLWTAAA